MFWGLFVVRVLIVGKHINVLSIKYVIQSMGHDAYMGGKLKDFSNKILGLNPDIVLIDLVEIKDEPDVDAFFDEIRNLKIPLIYISNHSRLSDDLEKTIFKKDNCYLLVRPFSENDLIMKVESVVNKIEKKSIVKRIHIGGVTNKELLYYLFLPLSLLTLFFAILSFFYRGESFSTNLTTEFISIVVTVTYVNWVFRRHKVKEWEETDKRISRRLDIVSNSLITSLRTIFKMCFLFFDGESYEIRISSTSNNLEVAREVIYPHVFEKLLFLDVENWKILIIQLEDVLKQIDRILMIYGNKLNSEKYSALLDIQGELEDIIKEYKAMPEFFTNSYVSDNHQKIGEDLKKIVAGKLKKILNSLTKLDQIK